MRSSVRLPHASAGYRLLVYLGLLLGLFVEWHVAGSEHMSRERVTATTILLMIPALVGARLCFVTTHWRVYRHDISRIWRRSDGGAALLGGLPLPLLAAAPLLAFLDVPYAAFWDVAAFAILPALIVGRLGCLVHGCCAGRPTTARVGVLMPNVNGMYDRRFPTQLYEAALAMLLLIFGIIARHHFVLEGDLFAWLLVGYGTGRFVLDWTRERGPGSLPLRMSLVAPAFLVVAGFVAVAVRSA